jgi:hypothetical protein
MLLKPRHPDPLICLIAFVGLGVLITMLYPDSTGRRDTGSAAGIAMTTPATRDNPTIMEIGATTAALRGETAI